MIFPPFLKPGNHIGIVAPARWILPKEIKVAINTFRDWGLEPVLANNLFNQKNQYSGTDTERTANLQQMLDDPSIQAIICARGGYGTVRIIDQLSFTKFCKKPKWLVGFSDITVLHAHINKNFKIATIHAMMPLHIVRGKKMQTRLHALESLRMALFGKKLAYECPPHPLNRTGKASGEIIGGNLSLLYSLNGSVSDIDTKGKILFLEDVDEYLYHIDRMMICMKRAGKLKSIKGLIVGGMSEIKDNKIPFGKTAEEIVWEAVKEYEYPVCFGFPAGHIDDNRALIMGMEAVLNITKKISTFKTI